MKLGAALGSVVFLFAATAAQAQTLPQLPTATTPLTGSELMYVVQGGVSKQVPSGSLPFNISALLNQSVNLGTGSLTANGGTFTGTLGVTGAATFNGATMQASAPFTQPYGNVKIQSQFFGVNSGAAYPITNDSGYGTLGFGAGALQSLTAAGAENVAFGPLACQMATTISLTTCVGMHSGGSIATEPGDTLFGNDSARDAISSGNYGYLTAIGESALAHGNPAEGTVAVGSQAGRGNSSAAHLSGSLTDGDALSLAIAASGSSPGDLTGLPLTASHTVAGGDTLASIATALCGQINDNISGPSYEVGCSETAMPDGSAAIMFAFPGSATTGWALTITPTVTGAQTETLTVSTGSGPIQSVFVGVNAGEGMAMQTPTSLTLEGNDAGEYITSASYIAAFGGGAAGDLMGGNGSDSVFGALAMPVATTSANISGVGFWVFKSLTTGNNDTALGRLACGVLTTGSTNTCIGFQVGNSTLATGSGVLLIGSGAETVDAPTSSTSNYINIENILKVTGTNTPSTAAATISGTLTPTGGIVGVTNASNATAGNVGEYVFADVLAGSGVSLTTATPANVTSISLTAGDWDVRGEVGFTPAGSTTITSVSAAINTASATLPGVATGLPLSTAAASFPAGAGQLVQLASGRVNVSTTTTVYLIAESSFGTSTMTAYGYIAARRVR